MSEFDILVVGAGSGGVRAARTMAGYGAKVAIVENSDLGGTCVNLGCVPKKLFAYASHYSEDFHDAKGFGWQLATQPQFDWPTLIINKNKEINRLNGVYGGLLQSSGVTCIHGQAELKSTTEVQVNERLYSVDKILIATGSWPWMPDIPGIEHAITSNEAFHLKQLPKRVAIVGGGYIAVEFAGIFRGLGLEVTLLYRGEQILRNFDITVRKFIHAELIKKGIEVKTNCDLEAIKAEGQTLLLALNQGDMLRQDLVMVATGRKPKVAALGLATANVELNKKGAIAVDDYYQTSQPNIYAIGDVIGKVQLTPVALAEAMAVAQTMVLNKPTKIDYTNIPTAVFCQPNIGTVGLTEEQARRQYNGVAVYQSEFKYLRHALTESDEQVLMKLIVDKATGLVVGVHMVGPDAGEIIQGMGVALKAGATKATFDATIGIHPTVAEEFVTMRSSA